MKDKIVVFGNSKLAQLADFYFTHDSNYEVVAFCVDKEFVISPDLWGRPLVSFEDITNIYPPEDYKMFVAIGYSKLNSIRAKKYYEAKEKGYKLVSYVSSKITSWGDTKIGDNCFILENQVIQPFVTFSNNVFIWSGNHFGHDVFIDEHCWLSSHIVCSGGVVIEPYTFVGINVSIRDNVRIKRENIIGAGAVILRDTNEKEVYITKNTEPYRLNSEQFERMMDISKQ